MHKSPKEIARSLRAFRNAHRLNLLRCVRIAPGDGACDAARSQVGVVVSGWRRAAFASAQCTRARCECDYVPVGSRGLDRLNVNKKSPVKRVIEKS